MSNSRRKLGLQGEDRASQYLQNNGYTILCRNWHYGHLELDIVCEANAQIVFVEVKTRKDNMFGGPQMAVTSAKQKNLILAAQAWLLNHDLWNRSCRFDIICLTGAMDNPYLQHFRNAFDLTWFMGNRHSAW